MGSDGHRDIGAGRPNTDGRPGFRRVRLEELIDGKDGKDGRDGRDGQDGHGGVGADELLTDVRAAREELRTASEELRAHTRELQHLAARSARAVSDLVPELLELIRIPLCHGEPRDAVRTAVGVCAEALGDVAVSVSVGPPAEPRFTVTSSPVAQRADGAQVIAGEGPAYAAWDQAQLVVSDDLPGDQRWPRAAHLIRDLPVHGVVVVPLRADGDPRGTLSAYQPVAGVEAAILARVEALASVVAAIVAELEHRQKLEDRAAQLQRAMQTRSTIDLAKGIVMAARRCDPDEAFAALVNASQHTNTKLRDIAATIVDDAANGRRPSL